MEKGCNMARLAGEGGMGVKEANLNNLKEGRDIL